MSAQFDFKKEWEKTKKQLVEFGKQATKIAKQGEDELVKFSERSVLHIDATAANLRKEKLYYQIGKAYVHQLKTKKDSGELSKLLSELNLVESEGKVLKKKIVVGQKSARKKAVKRTRKTPAKSRSVKTDSQ
jgi:hypothetical protein